MALIIGIDPATGSSSDTGFSVIDTETLNILYAATIKPTRRLLHHRIKDISDILDLTLQDIGTAHKEKRIIVCIESFVMRGKGGQTLQRLIGSFMGRIPYTFELIHVQNTTIKLVLAGHGHADKTSVATGLIDVFEENKDSQELIKSLLARSEFDIIDSLAIGVSGWQQIQQEESRVKMGLPAKQQKPKKRRKKLA